MESSSKPWRRHVARILVGCVLLALLLEWYPVRSQFVRLGVLAVWTGLLACTLALVWRRRVVRWGLIIAITIPALLLVIPGRPVNQEALAAAYVRAMRGYEGTRYVWGGEGPRGLDCSGLVRRGMIDACLSQDITNPALLRHALWLWWHDASAREMAAGYRGQTAPISLPAMMRDLPQSRLFPGDLGVTADGSHVVAHLGDGEWIEADPNTLRVRLFRIEPGEPLGGTKVTPCRWSILAER